MSHNSHLSRRDFLRKAGGAGAALALPTIITGQALGAEGVAPASERVRLGFIGVKNRGMQNLSPLMKHAVAVCDVDSDVLAAAKAKVEKANGTCAAYDDYRKLLEAKDIDAVVVSVPDHWHALITVDACAAGKDVYCEKPLSLTIAEGKAMVKAARHDNRVVQTGSQQRSDHLFRQACELVRNGKLGKINRVLVGLPGVNYNVKEMPDSAPPANLNYDFWLGPAPQRPYNVNHVHYNFRFFWDYSGGQMTNWGAHHLDIVQWALGMDRSGPVSVVGSGEFHPELGYEVPKTFQLTYTYADGTPVLCESGTKMRGGITFEGEKGTLWVNRGKIEATPAELLQIQLSGSDIHLEVSKDHYEHFLSCIKSRKRPITDVEIGHRSATVCHLGNIAVRSGEKVTWDPKAETIVGNTKQAAMMERPYRSPWHLRGV